MHPKKDELIGYIEGSLDDSRRVEMKNHLEICEFCQDFVRDYQDYLRELRIVQSEPIPEEFKQLAHRLFADAYLSRIIDLKQLESESSDRLYLAADTEPGDKPSLVALGTFYSESPEMVLKVMRDNSAGQDFLQLISDKSWLTSNVLIRVPEINRETITGEDGRAVFSEPLPAKIDKLKWQLKFPDAVFELSPLKYDPEKTEYEKEMTLETERKDLIKVKFQGKTEGKRIKISVLSLEGKSDFKTVKVAVSCEGKTLFKNALYSETVSFDIREPGEEIKIRLYQ